MYYDKKRDRVLLRNGDSFVTADHFALKMMNSESIDGLVTDDSFEIEKAKLHLQLDVAGELVNYTPKPDDRNTVNVDDFIDYVLSTERFKEHNSYEYVDRVITEFAFFEYSGNVDFLYKVSMLIQRFKDDGVVWGVGRGSSCSSLVMYLLEVHDVDPIKYDIDFYELSKTEESEYYDA